MKNALITGASRGLGLALARELAQKGWGLIIDACRKKALEEVRLELSPKTKVIAVSGDITTESHRKKLAKAASELGGLDALVNNASFLGPSPQPHLLGYPLDILEQVYHTNIIAPLGLIQALGSTLKLDACVINVTSDAGVEAYAGWGGYGSSKAALEHLSHILAKRIQDGESTGLIRAICVHRCSRKHSQMKISVIGLYQKSWYRVFWP